MKADDRLRRFIDSHQKVCLNLQGLILLAAIFLISLGQLQRIQLARTVAFYAHDLFVMLFIGLWILKIENLSEKIGTLASRWKYLIYFLLWSFFGLIFNQQASGFNFIPWLYLGRLITYLLFGLSISSFLKQRSCFDNWWKFLFYLLSGLFLFIGYSQYLLVPDLRFLQVFGWDGHYFRWAGVMLDPNFAGMILVNLLIIWLLTFKKDCRRKLYVSLVFIMALALTYSRSAYLSFALVTSISLSLPMKTLGFSKKAILLLFFGFLLMIPVLPRPGGLGVELRRTETITSRAKVNEAAILQLNPQKLLVGQGIFTPTVNIDVEDRIVHAHFPDNLLIFLLTATGLPGLMIAISFFTIELKSLFLKRKAASLLLLSGVLVHSMFNLTILEPINLLILLICLSHDL